MAEERLQKILARAGVASRRKAEDLITSGRVRVDGRVVRELGTKADARRSRVELNGKRLEPEPLCYGVLHKPRGMVTTLSDPEGRPTARDALKGVGVRVVPVGRLDFNTSGVLLFTNDGDFAQALQHAKHKVPKVYAATVAQAVDEKSLERWSESISIEGKETRPANVRVLRREGKKTWLEVTVKEGKNRQIRRLGEHAGTPVSRLARLSHAGITAEGLRPGQWRLLTVDELKALKKAYGVPEKIRGILEVGKKGEARGGGALKKPAGASARGSRRTAAPAESGARKGGKGRKPAATGKKTASRGKKAPPSTGTKSRSPERGSARRPQKR